MTQQGETPSFVIDEGEVTLDHVELSGARTLARVASGALDAVDTTFSQDDQSGAVPHYAPLIINRGAVTLTDALMLGAPNAGALIYQGRGAGSVLRRTLLLGPATYGVYLSDESKLTSDELLIDLGEADESLALYLGKRAELSAEGRLLQTEQPIILSAPEQVSELESLSCSGDVYDVSCSVESSSTDLISTPPCALPLMSL